MIKRKNKTPLENKSKKFLITYGGWYQRTTLHLSEIYDLFAMGKGKKGLAPSVLEQFHRDLNLKEVTREAGYLEYVKAVTNNDIEIHYYEDGLYILQLRANEVKKAKSKLSNYYSNIFYPAVNYIFSRGAPIPKILANIKTVHPTVVSVNYKNHLKYNLDSKKYGYIYSKISAKRITVFKTPAYIFLSHNAVDSKSISGLVEMQIFFREFKDQLEKYLDIHRNIWEKISDIKEKKEIKGTDVEKIRSTLDSYLKTVNLIRNRINQMGSYVQTRASISRDMEIEENLMKLFQYKFEILTNTLEYIKEIWQMTFDYLSSAIQILIEIQDQTMNVNLRSLRLITALGVLAGIIGYLSQDSLPEITRTGLIFFVVLIASTWIIDQFITLIYRRAKYRLKFIKEKRNL